MKKSSTANNNYSPSTTTTLARPKSGSDAGAKTNGREDEPEHAMATELAPLVDLDEGRFSELRKKLETMPEAELAQGINERLPEIKAAVESVQKSVNIAVAKAMETGFYLLESRRKIGHGKWLPWLKKHCTVLKQATAYRYMNLAEHFSHVINAAPAGLRQAYFEAGILKKKKPGKNTGSKPRDRQEQDPPPRTSADIVAGVKSYREQMDTYYRDLALDKFELTALDALSAEMSSLIESCKKVKEKLDHAKQHKPTGTYRDVDLEAKDMAGTPSTPRSNTKGKQ